MKRILKCLAPQMLKSILKECSCRRKNIKNNPISLSKLTQRENSKKLSQRNGILRRKHSLKPHKVKLKAMYHQLEM